MSKDIRELPDEVQARADGAMPRRKVISERPFPSKPWSIVGLIGTGLILGLIIGLLVAQLFVGTPTPTTQPTTTSNVAQVAVPAHKTYDAQAPAALTGSTVHITLTMQDTLITIAPGIAYQGWTFNGTVPGPVLRVRQGQTVVSTIINHGTMPHSIDFHAASTPWSVNYQSIDPGKSFTFTWKAMFPGVFMYHCGTPPVIYHIANGMYGTIIVDPTNGWSPAKEYALVQSEFYTTKNADGSYTADYKKMMSVNPDYVVFNGYQDQYKAAPLTVKVGQKLRLFIINAGPSNFSAFHIIGALFDDVYMDGNPANHTRDNQTLTIPPGGGTMIELTIMQPGLYPFVTHSFADATKGALGLIKVIP